MTWKRLLAAESLKLTSTRMPLGFVVVFVALSALNAAVVVFGTDADGSKTFISTAEDQLSLVAFAANAFIILGLFGAIAVAAQALSTLCLPGTDIETENRLSGVCNINREPASVASMALARTFASALRPKLTTSAFPASVFQ